MAIIELTDISDLPDTPAIFELLVRSHATRETVDNCFNFTFPCHTSQQTVI